MAMIYDISDYPLLEGSGVRGGDIFKKGDN